MSEQKLKLIYGHDPLCGWCFGLVPALRQLAQEYPNVEIDVLPGGLFRGETARSYSDLQGHITTAAPHMSGVTGQKLSGAFFEMLGQSETPLANSTPPNHAILQMKALAPDRVAEFAHALQEAHYVAVKDLNIAQTYDDICAAGKFPTLDTGAIVNAQDNTPIVAEAYAQSAALGIRSFPTCIVVDGEGRGIGAIQSIYEPQAFVDEFKRLADLAA